MSEILEGARQHHETSDAEHSAPCRRYAQPHGAWPLLLVLLLPGSLRGESAIADTASATAVAKRAQELLASAQPRDAIGLLKTAIEQHEAVKELRWLLAHAYMLDHNDFWALRTLATLAARRPSDCEPALWMGWIAMRQGALDTARDHLTSRSCPSGTPADTRRTLLLSMLEQHAGRGVVAMRHLRSARRAATIFAEDRAVMHRLTSRLDPGYVPTIAGKVAVVAGATSNARAGSPTDPAKSGTDTSSATAQLTLWLRFVGSPGRWIRPSLEGETRSQGYSAELGRDLSYITARVRPGVIIGDSSPAVLLAYRFDTLLLAGGDRYERGPLWFYNTHRAELEANILPNISLFGGAGRRLFREAGRSRTEADGGLGGSVLPMKNLRLLGAVTARWHAADKRAYDLTGGSALGSADLRLPDDWSLRGLVLFALDWYPHSPGYFDALAPKRRRRDVLRKLSASCFSPGFAGGKIGMTYSYATRSSTTTPYSYGDHRFVMEMTWSFSADPRGPRAVSPDGHVPLVHGLQSSGFDERLRDLLRQDEAAQRSSSCVD